MKMTRVLLFLGVFFLVLSCSKTRKQEQGRQVRDDSRTERKTRILFVDSYHSGYEWSDGITDGILDGLGVVRDVEGKLDCTDSPHELKIVEMDSKRNKGEDFKRQAGLRAKQVVDEWKPDLVIASDDNAVKYLVEPYLSNTDLPVVFCGVNWSIERYVLATQKNVTGMIEISHYEQLLARLRSYAKGKRVGYIAGEGPSTTAELEALQRFVDKGMLRAYEVNTFAEWKLAIQSISSEVDMLLINNNGGILEWDSEAAQKLIEERVTVPTGSTNSWMSLYNIITLAKDAQEQGRWSAETAKRILAGELPSKIPVVTSGKAKIFLNMALAKRAGIKFPIELIQSAHLIGAEQKKLLFIDSYHSGYQWSDDVETGLFKALHVKRKADRSYDVSQSTVQIKVFRMDTKRNRSESFKKYAAMSAKAIVDEWKPDIIVASDDNAAKYLIAPYFRKSKIPVVFCGLNWDASVYGFPTANITGMIEVAPVRETIDMLKPYTRGERLGYIAADTLTSRKNLEHYRETLRVRFTDGALVDNFSQWKTEYQRLQGAVDLLIWMNPIGIEGWSDDEAVAFIHEHTRIPTGAINDGHIQYALIGNVKIAEEQGWWAGQTVLRILGGTPPGRIPIARNRRTKLLLNMRLAKRLGIKFPIELLDRATLIEEVRK